MKGFQVTFFTMQDRHHGRTQMHEWLMQQANACGIRGSTALGAAEGIDHTGRWHSAHFFELADQPIEVTMAMTEEQATTLFEMLEQDKVNVFYVKAPVEFGTIGSTSGAG